MSAYAFRYRGDLLPNQSRETVQQNLARIFHAPPDSLDCIFNADAIFEVTDLEEDVAEAYERTFRAAGALGQISAVKNTQTLTDGAGPQPATPFDPNQSADYYVSSTQAQASASTSADIVVSPAATLDHHNRPLIKAGLALAAVGALLYVILLWQPPTEFIEQHAYKTESLPVGRHEYPIKTLDPANTIYLLEQKEMQAYLTWSIDAMLTQRMRPNTITEIADDTFRALGRYQAWRNFQHFLHLDKGKKLPYSLTKEGLKHHHESFLALLAPLEGKGPVQLQAAKRKWIDAQTDGPSPTRHFSKTLEKLLTQFQIKSMQSHNMVENPSLKAINRFDMAPLLPDLAQGVTAIADGNIVTFKFDKKELLNKPLHMAFYWNRFSRNKKWVYQRNLRIVSSDFPLAYLEGDFHIFRAYTQRQ